MPKPSLVVCGLLLLTSLYGRAKAGLVIDVHDPSDAPGGNHTCPGPTCNLRTAWSQVKQNVSIVLHVDVVMLRPLHTPPGLNQGLYWSSYVNITGRPAGTQATAKLTAKSAERIFSLDSWPFWSDQNTTFTLQHLEITGYSGPSGGQQKGIVCMGQFTSCTRKSAEEPRTAKRSRGEGAAMVERGMGEWAEGDPLPFTPDWEMLKRFPLLHLKGVTVSNFTLHNNTQGWGGFFFAAYENESANPVYVENCTFVGNSISGHSPSGMFFSTATWSTNDPTTVPVMIEGSTFLGNTQPDTHSSSWFQNNGDDGTLISSAGSMAIWNSRFEGNQLGATRAVAVNHEIVFGAHIFNSSFIGNEANRLPAGEGNTQFGTIVSNFLYMDGVNISLPASVPPRAACLPLSFWQQPMYLVNCSIETAHGYSELFATSVWNKNPIGNHNFTNPGSRGPYGFSNCSTEMTYFPCQRGYRCKELFYKGSLSGVECVEPRTKRGW